MDYNLRCPGHASWRERIDLQNDLTRACIQELFPRLQEWNTGDRHLGSLGQDDTETNLELPTGGK